LNVGVRVCHKLSLTPRLGGLEKTNWIGGDERFEFLLARRDFN
jgi:hypothetical protein